MERFASLLLAFCMAYCLAAQKPLQFTVRGTVTTLGPEPQLLKEVLVELKDNDVTMAKTLTDDNGVYDLGRFVSKKDHAYRVCFSTPCLCGNNTHVYQTVILIDSTDADFVIDRQVDKSRGCYTSDNSVYFSRNDSRKLLHFEPCQLKQLLDDYPGMIVRFTLCQLPGESKRLGKKRMRTFRRLLEATQVDLSRVQFSDVIFYYDESQAPEQAAIQGIVVALE